MTGQLNFFGETVCSTTEVEPKKKRRRSGFKCPLCHGPSRVRAIRRPTTTMAIRYLRCMACKSTFKTREHAIAKKRKTDSVPQVEQFPTQTPLAT